MSDDHASSSKGSLRICVGHIQAPHQVLITLLSSGHILHASHTEVFQTVPLSPPNEAFSDLWAFVPMVPSAWNACILFPCLI